MAAVPLGDRGWLLSVPQPRPEHRVDECGREMGRKELVGKLRAVQRQGTADSVDHLADIQGGCPTLGRRLRVV